MWPQKWKASASPGLTEPPAAAATSAPPSRARKPRREVARATAWLSSGMSLPPLGCRQNRLQLAEAVERALRADGAVQGECDRVRAPRNGELLPRVAVASLVEDLDGNERVAVERRDCRLERAAQAATLGREDGQREPSARSRPEPFDEASALADLRSLGRKL